jgi:hypothetical protein
MARQCWGDESSLQHLRQLGALRTARIIHIAGNLLRAFDGEFIEPINELGIAAHRIWPRHYGRPFIVKRLSIYNRLPTTRAATQRSLVLTAYCWSTNNDTAPEPCLLKAKAHSSHAVAAIHACKAAALDGGRAAARACSCCRRGCRSAS